MPAMTIRHKENETILYQGTHAHIRECVEAAMAEHIALHGADLRYLNLSNANLDSADLTGADLTGCNLTGANLSEATLDGTNFTHCSLESTCFAFSSLTKANFLYARFGGTHIEGTIMDEAIFSGFSCFHLEFIVTESMKSCRYQDEDGHSIEFSAPPLLLHGLPKPCIAIGRSLVIGAHILSPAELRTLKDPSLHRYRALLGALAANTDPQNTIKKAA